MTCRTFQSGRLHGSALVPPAKSEAHRALLLAALGRGECRLHGFTPPLCDDVQAMMDGIRALGATVEQEGDVLRVQPAGQAKAATVAFHARACATALRMLIPAFWVRGQAATITLAESLAARSVEALAELAEKAGVHMACKPAQKGKPARVEVSGKLHAGTYQIDGALSSQFASGLLVALAHATDAQGQAVPSRLTIVPPVVSRPYVDMTLGMMARFGLECRQEGEATFAIAPSERHNPKDIRISGDWTSAAVLFCANAVGSGVVVQNVQAGQEGEASLQGDAHIVALLQQMGMLAYRDRDEMVVTCPSRARLLPLAADCTDIPDLAPMLALICTQAHGQSALSGMKRLRAKECDRLKTTLEMLVNLGAEVRLSADDDVLTIQGPVALRGGFTADTQGDHRMVMMVAIAALIADAPIIVNEVEALDKSWPGFWETYQALGGKGL